MPLGETDGRDYIEEHLVCFTGLLREAGLPVGTAELLDALRALQYIDLSAREACKTALRATLVKSQLHREPFDRLFERYFVPPETRDARRRAAARRREQEIRELRQARRELRFKGESLDLSPQELLFYTALPEERRRRLLDFVRQTEEGKKVERSFRPLLESVVKGRLRYWRSRAAGLTGGGAGGSGGGGADLKDTDINAIREADLPAAEAVLERLARRLAGKLARRYRRSSRGGPFDFRRSVRENMRFGGSIFHLRYRFKRPPRRQLILLCDVSASMRRYSAFVLQFVYGLQAAVRKLETFCFADGLEHLTPALEGGAGIGLVLDRVVRHNRAWGGGTNLAAALEELLDRHRLLLNSRATVLVVSDTKTIALEDSLRALQNLKERAGRVIWLNTLPVEQWELHRSVAAIGALVEMWPCNTIGQLERVVSGKLLACSKFCKGGSQNDDDDRCGRQGRYR